VFLKVSPPPRSFFWQFLQQSFETVQKMGEGSSGRSSSLNKIVDDSSLLSRKDGCNSNSPFLSPRFHSFEFLLLKQSSVAMV
jgi:hypothetical protein